MSRLVAILAPDFPTAHRAARAALLGASDWLPAEALRVTVPTLVAYLPGWRLNPQLDDATMRRIEMLIREHEIPTVEGLTVADLILTVSPFIGLRAVPEPVKHRGWFSRLFRGGRW